ncbi:HAD family hydrolase [Marinomonas agarivorans]|nr:HAD family hydrolase [Marinomonas agarivorans]
MTVLITFDLDNTLWDVDPVIVRANHALYHWFEERLPGFNQHFSADELDKVKKEVVEESPHLKADISKLRIEMYRVALEQFGLPLVDAQRLAKEAFAFFHNWRQKVDLYPNTKDVLSLLAKQYRLAVITNGNADVFSEHIGLGSVFEFAIRADQVGVAKPEAGIFYEAANQANLSIDNMIHVGDHPHDDVQGINVVGGRSIWFNRHGARKWMLDWGKQPDSEVHSLSELPNAIRSLI